MFQAKMLAFRQRRHTVAQPDQPPQVTGKPKSANREDAQVSSVIE
jgi:hypothetical protein